jgi:hypothetical protein
MLLAAPFIARTANAASFPAPGVWPSGSPASVGLNVTKLMEAQAYAQQYGGGAGCVIRNGLLVHSWGSLSQLYLVQSATKSFGSALLGFAVDDGKVESRPRPSATCPASARSRAPTSPRAGWTTSGSTTWPRTWAAFPSPVCPVPLPASLARRSSTATAAPTGWPPC